MTDTMIKTVTVERVETVKRYITERRRIAQDYRDKAIGNTVTEAQICIQNARQCEDIASGMERALNILVG